MNTAVGTQESSLFLPPMMHEQFKFFFLEGAPLLGYYDKASSRLSLHLQMEKKNLPVRIVPVRD